MRKLNMALVGYGKVAHIHAAVLHNSQNANFRSVYGRHKERVEIFAQKYGVRAYDNLEEMLQKERLHAVINCTPHPAHAATTIPVLAAGIPVLVEKPLASSLQDCDAMLSAAKNAGVCLGMISQRRYYEPVLRVKRAIDAGKLDKPVLGVATLLGWRDQTYYQSDPWRGNWREEGGGVLVNQAPHQLDLLQWFMGSIDELYGFWGNMNHPYIEVEDTALAIIKFNSGAFGNILVSNAQNPALYGKVQVFGRNGASVGVQTDGGAMFIAGMSSIEEPPVNDLWTIAGEEHLLKKWQMEDRKRFQQINAVEYYHALQIEDFITAVIEKTVPLVTGEEGRKTVEIFTAIYRSQRDGKPVKFPLAAEMDRTDFDGRLNPVPPWKGDYRIG
jgi:UDP-N-acetyl-2-amino-2-deoxyglucuronate dehydrogenase